jgi:hypothetical protein
MRDSIAASSIEHDFVLVTRNSFDFDLIHHVEPGVPSMMVPLRLPGSAGSCLKRRQLNYPAYPVRIQVEAVVGEFMPNVEPDYQTGRDAHGKTRHVDRRVPGLPAPIA